MKEEALKLADELEKPVPVPNQPDMIYIDGHRMYGAQIIRRLVEELDCSESYIKQYQLERKPTITKSDGKVVAVTMTDDEHRVHEVLWEAPKPLSDEEIDDLIVDGGHLDCVLDYHSAYDELSVLKFELKRIARAIEERHGIE